MVVKLESQTELLPRSVVALSTVYCWGSRACKRRRACRHLGGDAAVAGGRGRCLDATSSQVILYTRGAPETGPEADPETEGSELALGLRYFDGPVVYETAGRGPNVGW